MDNNDSKDYKFVRHRLSSRKALCWMKYLLDQEIDTKLASLQVKNENDKNKNDEVKSNVDGTDSEDDSMSGTLKINEKSKKLNKKDIGLIFQQLFQFLAKYVYYIIDFIDIIFIYFCFFYLCFLF